MAFMDRFRPSDSDGGAVGRDSSGLAGRRLVMLHARGQGYPVVGEASYAKALAKLAGPLGDDGPSEGGAAHVAELIPEPSNRFDPDAIAVRIRDEQVGHVPRDATEPYHQFLRWARRGGWDGACCRATIMGGFRLGSGERAHLGVILHHTVPLMVQYDGPQATVPDSDDCKRVSLVGEQHSQPLLEQCLHRRVLVDLLVEQDNVAAVVDGQLLGRLSAKMAERYRDLVSAERARSGRATCIGLVVPGATKLEAYLKLPAASGLDAWRADLGPSAHTRQVAETVARSAPAGWYADPSGQHRLRYFDGSAWTNHTSA